MTAGSLERYLELTGRPTHELIAGSRLIVCENAAHGLPYAHTDRMCADIVALRKRKVIIRR